MLNSKHLLQSSMFMMTINKKNWYNKYSAQHIYLSYTSFFIASCSETLSLKDKMFFF